MYIILKKFELPSMEHRIKTANIIQHGKPKISYLQFVIMQNVQKTRNEKMNNERTACVLKKHCYFVNFLVNMYY